jgi:hypothetical protein
LETALVEVFASHAHGLEELGDGGGMGVGHMEGGGREQEWSKASTGWLAVSENAFPIRKAEWMEKPTRETVSLEKRANILEKTKGKKGRAASQEHS